MATMTIQGAAEFLGVSEITVRRKLKSGQLTGQQKEAPNGRWWVEISESQSNFGVGIPDSVKTDSNTASQDPVQILKDQVANLQHHLDIREREVGELHVIIQQQALALPPPTTVKRNWWDKLLASK